MRRIIVISSLVILLVLARRDGALAPALRQWRWVTAFAIIEMAIPWILLTTAEQHLAFVQQRGSASFLQTPAWAKVKPEWRGESIGFFAGSELFQQLHEAELGTFYLTDFLAKHFEALIWQGLGLDRHPALLSTYFGNYTRLLLLSQTDNPAVVAAAEAAATQLGLRFEHRHVGLASFDAAVTVALAPTRKVA